MTKNEAKHLYAAYCDSYFSGDYGRLFLFQMDKQFDRLLTPAERTEVRSDIEKYLDEKGELHLELSDK